MISGSAKKVYQHPDSPDALIKIVKYPRTQNQKKPTGFLYRLSLYWEYAIEIVEYLAVKEIDQNNAHYLEKIIGLVDTDLGVGLVVESVRTKAGNLAPTIAQIAAQGGLSEEQKKAFESILKWVSSTNIIIRDFSTNNVVWNEKIGSFVIVDGIGAKPTFSLRTFFRVYNLNTNKKKAAKLKSRILHIKIGR